MKICSSCGHHNPEFITVCLKCAARLGDDCPACGAVVSLDNKFCGQCGERMPRYCPVCRAVLPEGVTLCARCGANLEEGGKALSGVEILPLLRSGLSLDHIISPQPPKALMPPSLAKKMAAAAVNISGERREVTVLFLDVVGFTSSAHQLDSEDTFLMIDEAMRLVVEMVFKYEGTVDKFTGDGLMALFGAPIKHENDPERALRAALDMLEALKPFKKKVREEHGFAFDVRIGLNTGPVIAGTLGSDLHMEYTVIGDTVNLASRLEAAAQPGVILASFSTYQRTRPLFRFDVLPPLVIKGIPKPVRAFQPVGYLDRPGQIRGLSGFHAPMIGRKTALARLQEAYGMVRAMQRGRVALVTGEAGLGKSRLVAEFRQAIGEISANIYQGACLPYMQSTPLYVLTDLLRDMIRVSDTTDQSYLRDALHEFLDRLDLDNSEIFPYLVHALGAPQDNALVEKQIALLDASILQRQTFSAFRQLLLSIGSIEPAVLILDDLHWSDPASIDFLQYLTQSIGDLAILVILVFREAGRSSALSSLVSALHDSPGSYLDINLGPLSATDTHLLVDHLIQDEAFPATALKETIVNRAGGNPYFAEELLRILVDRHGLKRQNNTWKVLPVALELVLEVPGTLKDLILSRFDQLPNSRRSILQKASVLGSSFVISLMHALTNNPAEATLAYLRDLEKNQFLVVDLFGMEQGYSFRHSLLQEAVYSTLLKKDRRKMHYQAAQAIETGVYWLPAERNEILAYHYSNSDKSEHAVPFLIVAGENAARSFSHDVALKRFRQALALIPDEEFISVLDLTRAKVGLGQALKLGGEFNEALALLSDSFTRLTAEGNCAEEDDCLRLLIDSLREIADIYVREGEPQLAVEQLQLGLEILAESGIQEHLTAWRRIMDRLAWVYFRQGRLPEAYEIASQATESGSLETTKDPVILASLYNTMGGISWMRGELPEAIIFVERSLNIHQRIGYFWGVAIASTNLGILYYSQGKWTEASKSFKQADALYTEYGYVSSRPTNLKNLGELLAQLGQHEEAERSFRTSLEISTRLGMKPDIIHAEIGLARLAVMRSNYDRAAQHLQAAARLEDDWSLDQRIHVGYLGGLVAAGRGDDKSGAQDRAQGIARGIGLAEEALRLSEEAEMPAEKMETLRALGILHAQSGNYEQAEAYLSEAIELAVQQDDPHRHGQANFELAHIYVQKAKGNDTQALSWLSQAQEVLEKAITLFERLGAEFDSDAACKLLDEILNNMVAGAPK